MGSPIEKPAPKAIDTRASEVGLRAVAAFEAFKGLIVLLLLVALLAVHQRIEDYAEDLLYHLHIDFDRNYAQRILEGASRLSDSPLWTVGIAATLYAMVRFVEAWGLWNRRVWAEWFALLSGALYLPWEHVAILCTNIVIVLYMLFIRIRASRSKQAEPACAPRETGELL
jgi:uncharacterized membrane protein (DUF2068 family)